uniref:Large ribosomal subunit protein eL21 n=1 Tax=Anasa tristis TaxID=236421 RepID=I3RSJ5_ANATI|nr:ribosomal protein L21 [Anasa tristis]
MTNSKGYRRSTRTLFSREFRHRGYIPLSKLMTVYKIGEIVSVKVNGAIQKGMPHKSYQGKSGRVFNISKRGLGVIINKRVRGKIIPKRINVRLEHVKKNKSREEFLKRVHANEKLRKEAKEKGVFVQLKRMPEQPKPAHVVKVKQHPILCAPLPYEFIAYK